MQQSNHPLAGGLRSEFSRKRRLAMLALAAGAVALWPWGRAQAIAPDSWVNLAGGNWSNGLNWSNGTPLNGQDVLVTNAFSGALTVTYDNPTASLTYASVTLDGTAGGTDVLLISGNRLATSGSQYVGLSGVGIVNQSGSTNTLIFTTQILDIGVSNTAVGSYLLSAGSINNAGSEIVGDAGSGTFNQTGGSHQISPFNGSGSLNIANLAGATGTYILSAGNLTNGGNNTYIGNGGTGNFIQFGGTNSMSNIYLGYSNGATGAYSLSSGTLNSGGVEYIGYGGAGSFNQSGGAHTVQGGGGVASNIELGVLVGGTGTYTLSAGTLSAQTYVGYAGMGTFNQSGGAITNLSEMNVGFSGTGIYNQSGGSNLGSSGLQIGRMAGSTGTYLLSNGVLGISYQNVGYQGLGNFNQSGGTNSASLAVGLGFGSTGFYTLSAGQLNATGGDLTVAYQGNGTFNQSGGNVTFSGVRLLVAYQSGSTGSYTLSGGSMTGSTDQYVGNGGVGNFNQSGGSNVPRNLYIGGFASSTGSYTLSAGTVTTAQEEDAGYSGNGNFNQSGGSNSMQQLYVGRNYPITGTYTLSGGTLTAGVSEAIGIGTFTQSGGTNSMGAFSTLDIASFNPSSATYSLSGGLLSGANIENVGSLSTGNFVQTGGANALSGAGSVINLGQYNQTTGTYLLSGGAVSTSNVYVGGSSGGAGGSGSFAISGSGQLTVSNKLQIWQSGTVALTGPIATSSYPSVGSLVIMPGGSLVMNNTRNILSINYGTNNTPNVNIRKYLQNGYNAGHWDGGGPLINAGMGAVLSGSAGASANVYSIGYADGADNAAVNPSNIVQLLPAGREILKYTYNGDANLDGQVNLSDLIILSNHFGSSGTNWDRGDFSYDGSVNLTDLIILANNFGAGVGNPADAALVHSQFQQDLAQVEADNPLFAIAMGTAVPEPLGGAVLGAGAVLLLGRRRKSV